MRTFLCPLLTGCVSDLAPYDRLFLVGESLIGVFYCTVLFGFDNKKRIVRDARQWMQGTRQCPLQLYCLVYRLNNKGPVCGRLGEADGAGIDAEGFAAVVRGLEAVDLEALQDWSQQKAISDG